ncbi:phosphoribosylglycinamide formyltransferase, partial [Paraburkholderia sp. BR14261]
LAARVLRTEHLMYPRAVRWFVEGRLALDGERVTLTPAEPQWLFFDDSQAAGEGA